MNRLEQKAVPGQQHAGFDNKAYCRACGCSHFSRQPGDIGWEPTPCPHDRTAEADKNE